MYFRVLGPLEAEGSQGRIRIRGAKERAVLALLLVRANQLVSRDLLIDELWGDRPPQTARHTLEVYVSRLRRELAEGGNRSVIESQPGGYRICLEEDELDVLRFERLLEEGRSELEAGMLEEAEEKLAAALGLWRGPVLVDLAEVPFAETEAQRLEEVRLGGVEARLEVALRLGRHAELVGELQSLVASNPLRERLRAQLMIALYRSGRQVEALVAYSDGRRRLVEELGIEPGRDLQELEQAILRHDPALESPTTFTETPAASAKDGGIPVAPPVAAVPERRKIVTVVFCDVMGSTAPDEHPDPEALKALLDSFFGGVQATVEFHGGTVERVTGSAAVAVFGVPVVHEDDALRACRAAFEMRDRCPELGLQGRIGVSSGEVVTGASERLAIGGAVDMAAQLQQAAEPGDVLIGSVTLELARDSIEVGPADPLTLNANAEPVPVYRLLSVGEGKVPRPAFEPRFVGRASELALLRGVWERGRAERRCELVTILGEAGIGKSRLVSEAFGPLEARVVRSRCLPYGNGITYWPAVEVIKQLDAEPVDPVAATAVRSLLAGTGPGASADEIASAVRKLLEQEAPLVVVFEDVHWGEETFLDLVEAVTLLSTGAPLLIVCTARPELLAKRVDWPVTLRLGPLPDEQVMELIGDRMPADVRERVARAAGGNPLFVVELLAMAEWTTDVEMPATLQALLAARLDQLDEPERHVLECAAVEGEVFHRGAVHALMPEEPQPTRRLATLVRGGLIRPSRAQIAGEEAFRFAHLLLCNAAYDSLSKTIRAELHERFAAWLEERGAGPVELDEIVGHHLERAAGYLQELGSPDGALAERAGDKLAAAGRRALRRTDYRTAVPLLERALELTRPIRLDVRLEIDLANALVFGPYALQRAIAIADAAADRAGGAGDEPGQALARVVAAHWGVWAGAGAVEKLEALARAALPLLEQAGDHAGLRDVWWTLGFSVANTRGRFEDVSEAYEEALRHDRLAGERRTGIPARALRLLAWGPRPAGEVLTRIDELRAERATPVLLLNRAVILAMLGRFDEARQTRAQASAQSRAFGDLRDLQLTEAEIATLAGDHETAARHLRRACDQLKEHWGHADLTTGPLLLARELCALGQYDEAERLARQSREALAPLASDDAIGQMLWRQVQALVHTHRGDYAEAERLAREAVEIGERTDALDMQGDALCDLAEVLDAAGRSTEAAEALEQALDRYRRKQNLAMVHQVEPRLETLRTRALAAALK